MSSEKTLTLLPVIKETKHQKYNRSQKGRDRYARYRASPKGILNEVRWDTKRRAARFAEVEGEFNVQKVRY